MLMNRALTSFTRKMSWMTANLLSCCTFISTPGRPNLSTSMLRLCIASHLWINQSI